MFSCASFFAGVGEIDLGFREELISLVVPVIKRITDSIISATFKKIQGSELWRNITQ